MRGTPHPSDYHLANVKKRDPTPIWDRVFFFNARTLTIGRCYALRGGRTFKFRRWSDSVGMFVMLGLDAQIEHHVVNQRLEFFQLAL